MAKKQTRRSISVSRTTYERLKAFCEANNISMSQLVETRVNDFLTGDNGREIPARPADRPTAPVRPVADRPSGGTAITPVGGPKQSTQSSSMSASANPYAETRPAVDDTSRRPAPQPAPMTSVAARFAVEPPPPIIKQKQQEAAPKPAEKRPDQIFTF